MTVHAHRAAHEKAKHAHKAAHDHHVKVASERYSPLTHPKQWSAWLARVHEASATRLVLKAQAAQAEQTLRDAEAREEIEARRAKHAVQARDGNGG